MLVWLTDTFSFSAQDEKLLSGFALCDHQAGFLFVQKSFANAGFLIFAHTTY